MKGLSLFISRFLDDKLIAGRCSAGTRLAEQSQFVEEPSRKFNIPAAPLQEKCSITSFPLMHGYAGSS